MAKKYSSKKQVKSEYQKKIDSQKYYYDLLRQSGRVEGGFYSSDIYKRLNRNRQKALYRYENREKISQQEKERRERMRLRYDIKENKLYDGEAIDAFKGRKGKKDMDFLKEIKHDYFVGTLIVEPDGIKKSFSSIPGFFRELSVWINSLFRKDLGYQIFETEVQKKTQFDKATKTLYYTVTIIKPGEDE